MALGMTLGYMHMGQTWPVLSLEPSLAEPSLDQTGA